MVDDDKLRSDPLWGEGGETIGSHCSSSTSGESLTVDGGNTGDRGRFSPYTPVKKMLPQSTTKFSG